MNTVTDEKMYRLKELSDLAVKASLDLLCISLISENEKTSAWALKYLKEYGELVRKHIQEDLERKATA